jgi:hypothetical protein
MGAHIVIVRTTDLRGVPNGKPRFGRSLTLPGAWLLFSARISNEIATDAARALAKRGWTTANKMTAATWEERTHVLNHAGSDGASPYPELGSKGMLAAVRES